MESLYGVWVTPGAQESCQEQCPFLLINVWSDTSFLGGRGWQGSLGQDVPEWDFLEAFPLSDKAPVSSCPCCDWITLDTVFHEAVSWTWKDTETGIP